VISHPFEIEPSTNADDVAVLMITWRGAPPQSVAELYLPAVSAERIVVLGGRLYGRHRLTATDAHTLQFPAADLALVPIPAGSGRCAGLLSVEPHPDMPSGSSFTVSVRQLDAAHATIRPPPPPPPPPPVIRIAEAEVADTKADTKTRAIAWRRVQGAFQYTVKAKPQAVLAPEQARLVSWLKWRLGVLPVLSRWKPVLERYLKYSESLLWNLGVDPNTIPPSQSGLVAGEGGGHEPPFPVGTDSDCVGKVEAIVYDRFGDFCGFVILTEAGHERHFRAHESAVEHLVREAWVESSLIRVAADAHHPDRVRQITLLRRH
jgi:hypothetical protein